jgi:hypothetical protein
MDRKRWDELISYLPKYSYVVHTGNDNVDVRWTNPKGRFRLVTGRVNVKDQPYIMCTRVVVIAEITGECVTLMTEDVQRIITALNLLEAL